MATIKKLYFSSGTAVTAPTDLSLESSTNNLATYVDDAAFVAANGTAGEGDVYLNTTLKAPRAYISGAWRTGIMVNDAADPTKTVGFDLTGSTTGTAQTLDFDNTASRVYTFPNYDGRVVIQTGTETNPVLFPTATGNIDVGSATSTTRIVGNLEVQGTTTTFNTQTVQVEDNNMILNFGGNDTTAQGSGLQVDRTGTDGSFIYDSAAATKWKAGNLGSEVEIVDKSTAQALTNKTIDASQNTISNIGSSMLTGTVAPSKGGTGVANNDAATLTRSGNHALTVTTTAPTNVTLPTTGTVATLAGAEVLTNKDIDGGTASNTSRWTAPKATKTVLDSLTRKEGTILYGTDTKKHYTDDGLTLNEMGGGAGGAAGRNYLQSWYTGLNPIASVTGLTSTGNRTSNQTLWGTSATADFEAINNVTSPLREGGDIKLDSKTTTINAFVETPMFSLDLVDLSKAIVLSFDVTGNSADGNYDVVVIRYNSAGTYQETISVAGNASTGTPASAKLPTGTTTFKGFFIAGSTASDLYSVRFRKLLAVNVDVQIDTLFVGPQSLGTWAVVTDWQSYTPTYTGFGTVTASEVYYRRVGNNLEVRGNFTTGTTTGTEARLSFPTGLTSASFQSLRIAGNAIRTGASGTFFADHVLVEPSVQYFTFGVQSATSNGLTKAAGTFFQSSTKETFFASVEIAEWSSANVTMADRQVEEFSFNTNTSNADDTTSFGDGAQGVDFGSYTAERIKRVRFKTTILPTDVISIEFKRDGQWLPVTLTGTQGVMPLTFQTTTSYGVGFEQISGNNTDINVRFGTYRNNTSTYGAAGNAWSFLAGGVAQWRVRKVSGGASVGFPVSARNIVGDTSGTAVPSGYVGESFEDTSGTFTATTIANMFTRTLQPGKWRISYTFACNSGAGPTGIVISISTTSATHDITYRSYGGFNSTSGFMGASVERIVTLATPTTFYITTQSAGSNISNFQTNTAYWVRIS